MHEEPKSVLHLYVGFDSDWYVPYGSAETLTRKEAEACYLEALEENDLPVPTTPYNPLIDSVAIMTDRSDMESFQMYSLAPITDGRLLYSDVKRGPRSGWRITINHEVVYEGDTQEPDDDRLKEEADCIPTRNP
jgi:hypothetical protein